MRQKVQELHLAFQYSNVYSPFLSVARSPKQINIIEAGLLWKRVLDVSDAHITYPENGRVHFTFRKDGEYAVHVFKDQTTITCYTPEQELTNVPDYNSIAIKTLTVRSMVRPGPFLNEFKDEDFYSFPTVAFTVEPEGSMSRTFDTRRIKSKYGQPIDLTNKEGSIINVHVFLTGSKEMPFHTLPGTEVIKQASIGASPLISVVVTAKPNSQ